MGFQFQLIAYTMYIGVALASLVLFPLPRIIRKPFIKGLEIILNNQYTTKLIYLILSWAFFMYVQAFTENKEFSNRLIEEKALRDSKVGEVSYLEMEKTVNQTRMQVFFSQRNIYLTSFTILLYGAVFTYLKSLIKLDAQLDAEEKLNKQLNAPKAAVQGVKQ